MSEFYDGLETRDPEVRQQSQLEALRKQISHVQSNTGAYAGLLKEIDASTIVDAQSFSAIPLTRKSELIELQRSQRPRATVRNARAPTAVQSG